MPLNENNKYILNDTFKIQGNTDIQALQLSSNTTKIVQVEKDQTGVVILKISDTKNDNRDMYFIDASEKRIIELISTILNVKCIRLFPVEHPIAIYDWLSNNP